MIASSRMRAARIVLMSLVGLAVLLTLSALSPWAVFDYGYRCTKCLADSHVVERSFIGFIYSKTVTPRGAGSDYERIFGQPCQHVFRKGGCGRRRGPLISCGETAEGVMFAPRNIAVKACYDL